MFVLGSIPLPIPMYTNTSKVIWSNWFLCAFRESVFRKSSLIDQIRATLIHGIGWLLLLSSGESLWFSGWIWNCRDLDGIQTPLSQHLLLSSKFEVFIWISVFTQFSALLSCTWSAHHNLGLKITSVIFSLVTYLQFYLCHQPTRFV